MQNIANSEHHERYLQGSTGRKEQLWGCLRYCEASSCLCSMVATNSLHTLGICSKFAHVSGLLSEALRAASQSRSLSWMAIAAALTREASTVPAYMLADNVSGWDAGSAWQDLAHLGDSQHT